ncbi:MAG: SMC family ATPase [Chlorobiaceae bacterium]
MHILSLYLSDIKSHRNTELSFSAGINVLSGANGAGKSTVFEAIGYALFGVDARDFVSNVERFISIGAKRGKISVVFQCDDGQIWQVTRTVGNASKWLLAKKSGDSFEVEEHAGIAETETRLAGLLGLANGRSLSEQFKLVIGPFQNDFLGPFIIKQATRRQEAFDEILGIDTWRKTYKGTKSLLSVVQEKIKILDAEVQLLKNQVEILPEKEQEFIVSREVLEEKQMVLKEKDAAFRKIETLLTDFDYRAKAITTLSGQIDVLEGRIKDGREKIANQRQRVDEALKALNIVEQSRKGKDGFDKAEKLLEELRKMDVQRRLIEQGIAEQEVKVRLLSQTLEYEEKEITRTDNELNAEEIELSKTRATLLENEQLVNTAALLQELRHEENRLQAERSILEGRREGLAEGKDDLAEGICPFFQEQCMNVVGFTPKDLFSVKIDELNSIITDLEMQIKEVAQMVAAAQKAEKELNENKIRLHELDRRFTNLEERRKKNRKRFDSLEKTRHEKVVAASQVEGRQADLKVFASLDAEIEKSEKDRKIFQVARDAFNVNLKDAEDLANRREILSQWERGLNDLKKNLTKKQAELSSFREQYQAEKHQEMNSEKYRLVTELAIHQQEIEEIGRTRERLDKEIKALKQGQVAVSEKQQQINLLKDKEELVEFLRNQVFKNVSAQLSERFREEISFRADSIYRTIAESDEELHWGDNYQIMLRDMVDGVIRERSDDQLSGGQTMSAVVALRLALLQTIGARIAFFDEPTSNLDFERRENLAHAFRTIDVGREEVAEHWYDQLFLISHDVAFTEITDQIIRIGG